MARAAEVESVVTRSISGHLTEQMQLHYSTVNPDEQRRSIGKVIDLMQVREQRSGGTPNAPSVLNPLPERTRSASPRRRQVVLKVVLSRANWYSN